jgi:hypothetical protein
VLGSMPHGIVAAHGRDLHICRAYVLCRAFDSAVAVCVSLPCALGNLCRAFPFAVFSGSSLPCALWLPCVVLLWHGKDIFAV